MSKAEDDLYGDLYGGAEDEVDTTPATSTLSVPAPAAASASPVPAERDAQQDDSRGYGGPSSASAYAAPIQSIPTWEDGRTGEPSYSQPQSSYSQPSSRGGYGQQGGGRGGYSGGGRSHGGAEDGKMFIGGLNWDTDDDGLAHYFEQFGHVTECTIMRDPSSGRSRGFAFLTFQDPAAVNAVMVREHFLDGKTIDPKRAIPKKEDMRTNKLFVRSIPLTVTQQMFQQHFQQYGPLSDCTLMMDRDTNQHRGFGFVTYKGEECTDKAINAGPHYLGDQQVEVKKSAPRPDRDGGGRGGYESGGRGGYNSSRGGGRGGYSAAPAAAANPMAAFGMGGAGFDPNAMAEYFKQAGWANWNPMMMMNPGMMGQMGAGGMGMGMGQMPMGAYGAMPGQSGDDQGSSGSGGYRGRGRGRGGHNPFGLPQNDEGGAGPVRSSGRGRSNYQPY